MSVPMISWWCFLQFLGGLVATIFLDIIYISIFYSSFAITDTGRFSAGMAIFSLLLKPFSCCLIYHMHRERGGELPRRPGKARSALPLPGPVGKLPATAAKAWAPAAGLVWAVLLSDFPPPRPRVKPWRWPAPRGSGQPLVGACRWLQGQLLSSAST